MPASEANNTRISVVILNWNRPDDTEEAVRTTLAQDFQNFEIVVWDNASSDDSRNRLTRLYGANPKVRLLWGDKNYGVAGGRNRAFRAAGGDILMSLDSDAVIETPDGLRRIVASLDAEPGIGAVSFEVRRPDGHLMWPFARPSVRWREHRFDTIRVDGCSFATPRHVFEQVGGFAEHFSPYGAEDQYYAYQVVGAGYRVVYDPQIKVIHSFTPRARHGRQFAMHVRNMIWMPLELFPAAQAFARAALQSARLAIEAFEQHEIVSYVRGILTGWLGPWPLRRRPMNRASWKKLVALIEEDKRHAGSDAAIEHGLRMS